jgi:hypothetical protein
MRVLCVLLAIVCAARALDNGVASTPAMGYNTVRGLSLRRADGRAVE